MKYLKRYNNILESTLGELSFEDFQDIIIDLIDNSDEFNISEQDDLYEFSIKYKLSGLFKSDNLYYDVINENKGELNLNNINNQIKEISKLINDIKEIENNIINRLVKFENCIDVQIGTYRVGGFIYLVLQYIISDSSINSLLYSVEF